MSWRGTDGGLKAAKRGHDVVMAPWDKLYLDYLQTMSPTEEPGRPTQVTLETVYAFEPVPSVPMPPRQAHPVCRRSVDRAHAQLQGCAACGIPAHRRCGGKRVVAARGQGLRRFPADAAGDVAAWRAIGIAPADTPFQPLVEATAEAGGKVRVDMSQPLGYAIRYTTDGSMPTPASTTYAGSLSLALPVDLQAQAFAGEQALAPPVRRAITAAALRSRSDEALAMCTGQLMLRLEDDGPRRAVRAIFNVDIFNPCWSWKQAPLTDSPRSRCVMTHPLLFPAGDDESHRGFKPEDRAWRAGAACGLRRSAAGDPADAAMPDADGFVTLRAPLRDAPDSTDLCVWFTGDTRPSMWVLDRVTLVPPAATP